MAVKKPAASATRKKKTTRKKTTSTRKKTTTRKTGTGTRKKSTAARKKTTVRKKATARKKTAGGRKKTSRKYGPGASESVRTELHEMHKGRLRSGTSGEKVTSRKQAIAIGLSEARRKGDKVPNRRKRSS